MRALITGGNSGIGLALAHVFAREGYDVFLVARDSDSLAEAAARIRQDHGVEARFLATDLSKPQAANKVVDSLNCEVDVLVNNAGIGVFGLFEESSWEREQQMLELNVVCLTQLTKLLVPRMKKQGWGRVLNVSSVAAFLPGPYMSVYYASKAYVKSFSEALSEELLGSEVSVTCLCPGPTHSSFAQRAGAEDAPFFSGRLMTASAVAEAGYRGLMKNRRVVVPGFSNKLNMFLTRVLPRWLQARIVAKASKPD